MTDSRDRRSGRRLGTPRPEWGDNVIQADFGARGRRAAGKDAAQDAGQDAGQDTAKDAAKTTGRTGRGRGRRGAEVPSAESWAGRVLLDAVSRDADTARLSRGREYFRAGKVLRTELELSTVTALVSGSQLEPFEVSLQWRPLSDNQASYVRGECLEHPENLSRLLAGREPRRDVCALLFRVEDLRDSWCTCPDRSGMCKHRIAVAYAVAERFTADPVTFLDWRGIDTAALLAEAADRENRRHPGVADLRRRPAGQDATDGSDGTETSSAPEPRYTAAEFWGDPARLPQWSPMDVERGLDLGDRGLRDAVIRKVSWNTVDQLHVLDELETCYDLLTGDTGGRDGGTGQVFDPEPWLSGPSGRIGDHD